MVIVDDGYLLWLELKTIGGILQDHSKGKRLLKTIGGKK